MKSILGLATVAFVILVLDEKVREIASDAHDSYGKAVGRVQGAAADTRRAVRKQPLPALLAAGTAGFFLAGLTARHR